LGVTDITGVLFRKAPTFPPGIVSQDDVTGFPGPTTEALQAVASVYREARLLGKPPTRAVMDKLGLSYRTAGRWAAKAREEGLL
jgi:hypothetical protein